MTNQGSLFQSHATKAGTSERVCGQPVLAGATDGATAHAAAAALVRSGRHGEQVLAAVRRLAAWTGQAPTCFELALGDVALRYQLAKRLPDAAKQGLVRVVGERPCKKTGNTAQTWAVTDEGRRA